MKFLVLLCAITVLAENPKPTEQGCEEFMGTFHKTEVLAKGLNRPYQMSYHQNKIFFSNNVGDDEEDKFEIRWIDEKDKESEAIEGVRNGFAVAIDTENQVAYFGGSDGIYKSDLNVKGPLKVQKIVEEHNIWDMFFKKDLYFITYPTQRLYKYFPNKEQHQPKSKKTHDGNSKGSKSTVPEHERWVHEKIYQFAIDGDDDIFITNETGLFMIKRGTQHRIHYEGEKIFRAVEVNNKGHIYFCGQNGIYAPIKHNHTLHKVANIKNIFGLVFDGDDNFIYSNPHQIIKILPTECKKDEVEDAFVPIPIPT